MYHCERLNGFRSLNLCPAQLQYNKIIIVRGSITAHQKAR